jgi:hypothetical protein
MTVKPSTASNDDGDKQNHQLDRVLKIERHSATKDSTSEQIRQQKDWKWNIER